jgi:hypothetical protein
VAQLRLADGASPMTWGIRRPAVAIPAAVAEWPAARREPVLRHELAHVARRDCLTQALASLACALYWFHPGAWVAARRMRLERELACDDRVLAAGARPSGYARELLEMANALARSASPALAVSMASRPNLETRLRAAIDPARVRTEPGRRVRLGAGVLAAGIVATVSAAQAATPAPVTPPASPAIHTQRPVAPRAADAAAPSPVSTAEDRTVAAGTSGSDAAAPASAAQEELRGEWRIDPSGQSGMVQLSMVAGGNTTGLPVPRSRLEGLAESGSTRFQVRGEAGVVEFTGSMNGGHGTGSFRFTPDRGFAAQLTRRGLEAPSTYDQMRMTISGATLAGADALLAALPTRPGTQDLTRLFTHSIAPDDIRGIVAAGYRDITAEQVVRLKSHGIDAALLGEYQRQGDASLAPEMVIRMHNHGVTPEDVRAAGERAGRPVDPQMIIYGKRHGAKKWN